jgi:hypothetical protein
MVSLLRQKDLIPAELALRWGLYWTQLPAGDAQFKSGSILSPALGQFLAYDFPTVQFQIVISVQVADEI